MSFLIRRLKGMFVKEVMFPVSYLMMIVALLISYRVLSGKVPDVALAAKGAMILIIQTLILVLLSILVALIPIIKSIRKNGLIKLLTIDVDEDIENKE